MNRIVRKKGSHFRYEKMRFFSVVLKLLTATVSVCLSHLVLISWSNRYRSMWNVHMFTACKRKVIITTARKKQQRSACARFTDKMKERNKTAAELLADKQKKEERGKTKQKKNRLFYYYFFFVRHSLRFTTITITKCHTPDTDLFVINFERSCWFIWRRCRRFCRRPLRRRRLMQIRPSFYWFHSVRQNNQQLECPK